MRPTLKDLAEAADVSTATADRALNNRAGVSPRTRALVLQAALRIGYLPEKSVPKPVHLVVLLPKGTNAFVAELRRHIEALSQSDPTLSVAFPDLSDPAPEAMARALDRAAAADGVALLAQSHPAVHDAIDRLARSGTPVVTLASDLPESSRLAYVGIDDRRAGRLAGQVILRFLGPSAKGKIALFSGSQSYRGHHDREMGLRQIVAESAPNLTVLGRLESGENRNQAQALTEELLATHPDLVAVYNAGGGTRGIARALQASGRARDIVFVAHDLTEPNRAHLIDGTLDAVIDQSARDEAQEALAILTAAARGEHHDPAPPQHSLLFLRENLPP
ncbi:substrate-binding domain-containing protein [Rhodobacterales bacterium HKCCE4037]|nr:substrate-binding domain-containing protein [Rhodobacterales bacterium HKCCE4037]